MLAGMPEMVDLSSAWQIVAIHNDEKANAFQAKFGIRLTSTFRHAPQSFARLLAKIGYCHMLVGLEPEDFRPICLPYILGKPNPSYVVGSSLTDLPPDKGLGYTLRTACFGTTERLMLLAEIRLLADNATPVYHVVVGDVVGREKVAAILEKLGPGVKVDGRYQRGGAHMTPGIWPPLWQKS
jgi:hypothetical protein